MDQNAIRAEVDQSGIVGIRPAEGHSLVKDEPAQHPDIHPNELSERTGRSVYDILMHLSPDLPGRDWVVTG
jgi:hypothetical protein